MLKEMSETTHTHKCAKCSHCKQGGKCEQHPRVIVTEYHFAPVSPTIIAIS